MSIIIGIDVGGSTTKIVGFTADAPDKKQILSPIYVKASDPVASVYGAFGKFTSTNGISLSDVKKCQQKLEQRIARYNEENEIHLSAAWGHAFFNPETDHGLSEIVKRADGMLYAMKRAMKQAAENAS